MKLKLYFTKFLTVSSYRFIYLLVVWLMTLAADLDYMASNSSVISE